MMATRTRNEKRNLKVVFDGVIAVGPGHTDEATRPGPFFGVMARSTRRLSDRTRRLRRAKGKKNKEKALYIPMHVPTIFTLMEPTKDSRPPDQVLQLSPVHPRWYLWHPFRERLEFRFDGDGTSGPLAYLRGPQPTLVGHEIPTAPIAIHGIDQVPDLRLIWPERSVLLDGLLSADPGVNASVMTQVLVPYGLVAGAGTLDKGNPLEVVFDPPRGLPKHDALVPNAAVMVQANTIEIASYSLDTGERLDSIKFRMRDDAEIWLSNGDPSDVEIDMDELAKQVAERTAQAEGKTGGAKKGKAQQFAEQVNSTFRFESPEQNLRAALEFYHGSLDEVTSGLAIDHHRAGNVDIDFELFYTLTKNAYLALDGRGLPVPRRPRPGDEFNGPNCYLAICDTLDKLFLKSQDR